MIKQTGSKSLAPFLKASIVILRFIPFTLPTTANKPVKSPRIVKSVAISGI